METTADLMTLDGAPLGSGPEDTLQAMRKFAIKVVDGSIAMLRHPLWLTYDAFLQSTNAGHAETDVHVSCVWLTVIQVHAEGHARFGCCIWQVGSCSMLNTLDVCVRLFCRALSRIARAETRNRPVRIRFSTTAD